MGIISKLKEIFDKNIECGNEIVDHIVLPWNKKKFIYLNKNIFVREKSSAVIVYKYKVCDVLLEGKYKLNKESIPEIYSNAKIDKKNHSGAKIKKLRSDVYFVNLSEFKDFIFISDMPFVVKSDSLGRVKGYLSGTCTVKVIDSGALIKALINDTGKAKLSEINNDIGLWIGNKINKIIDKNKIPITQVLSEKEYIESIVNEKMQDALDNIGIYIANIKLKSVDFPKRYQSKVNDYLSKNKRIIKNFDVNSAFNSSSVVGADKVTVSSVTHSNFQTNSSSAMQMLKKYSKNQSFKVCNTCKKENDINGRFCINCGSKLE